MPKKRKAPAAASRKTAEKRPAAAAAAAVELEEPKEAAAAAAAGSGAEAPASAAAGSGAEAPAQAPAAASPPAAMPPDEDSFRSWAGVLSKERMRVTSKPKLVPRKPISVTRMWTKVDGTAAVLADADKISQPAIWENHQYSLLAVRLATEKVCTIELRVLVKQNFATGWGAQVELKSTEHYQRLNGVLNRRAYRVVPYTNRTATLEFAELDGEFDNIEMQKMTPVSVMQTHAHAALLAKNGPYRTNGLDAADDANEFAAHRAKRPRRETGAEPDPTTDDDGTESDKDTASSPHLRVNLTVVGPKFNVIMNMCWCNTVATLKAKIQREMCISVHAQHLVIGGVEVQEADEKPLSAFPALAGYPCVRVVESRRVEPSFPPKFEVGEMLNVLDTRDALYRALILEKTGTRVYIRFVDWSARWNEWIEMDSWRIQRSADVRPSKAPVQEPVAPAPVPAPLPATVAATVAAPSPAEAPSASDLIKAVEALHAATAAAAKAAEVVANAIGTAATAAQRL